MAVSLTHSTPADGSFSATGAVAWDAQHVLTQATNKLLGRTTAGTGATEEISVGTGLSLSAGTLSATGGGSSTAAVGYTINGGGSTITTGVAGNGVSIPFNATITAVRLQANTTGSIIIDIWKDTYANYPPTVADSICASAKPTISSAVKSEDTTLTGWTTSITAGDILYFNVDSVASIANVVLTLTVTKT